MTAKCRPTLRQPNRIRCRQSCWNPYDAAPMRRSRQRKTNAHGYPHGCRRTMKKNSSPDKRRLKTVQQSDPPNNLKKKPRMGARHRDRRDERWTPKSTKGRGIHDRSKGKPRKETHPSHDGSKQGSRPLSPDPADDQRPLMQDGCPPVTLRPPMFK